MRIVIGILYAFRDAGKIQLYTCLLFSSAGGGGGDCVRICRFLEACLEIGYELLQRMKDSFCTYILFFRGRMIFSV